MAEMTSKYHNSSVVMLYHDGKWAPLFKKQTFEQPLQTKPDNSNTV